MNMDPKHCFKFKPTTYIQYSTRRYLHLTSSVGQRARLDQKAARKPLSPLWRTERSSVRGTPATLATSFWHPP